MKRYKNYILFFISLSIIFFFLWFIFIKEVKPQTIKKGDCFGYNCKSIGCNGNNCIAHNCTGENCIAGNCVGNQCKAGNCYGYNCTPGKCIDPKCPMGICPQQNKDCTDGKKYNIKRPFYFKYTKRLPYGTFFNPPLCSPSITVGDLREGRAKNLGIKSVNINNIGTVQFNDIFSKKDIKDDTLINWVYPLHTKDENCKICVGSRCER